MWSWVEGEECKGLGALEWESQVRDACSKEKHWTASAKEEKGIWWAQISSWRENSGCCCSGKEQDRLLRNTACLSLWTVQQRRRIKRGDSISRSAGPSLFIHCELVHTYADPLFTRLAVSLSQRLFHPRERNRSFLHRTDPIDLQFFQCTVLSMHRQLVFFSSYPLPSPHPHYIPVWTRLSLLLISFHSPIIPWLNLIASLPPFSFLSCSVLLFSCIRDEERQTLSSYSRSVWLTLMQEKSFYGADKELGRKMNGEIPLPLDSLSPL